MKRHYDYTLIDSRTGLSDVADICTIHLPDILVDCFTLSDQGIDGAAQVAAHGRPTATRAATSGSCRCRCGSTTARRRRPTPDGRWPCAFDGLPAGHDARPSGRPTGRGGGAVPAFYAYEETLATFGDVPGVTQRRCWRPTRR